MARSKKVDSTGQSNDNRSIHLENTDQGSEGTVWNPDGVEISGEGVFNPKSERLTHKIEVPEHIRKMMGL